MLDNLPSSGKNVLHLLCYFFMWKINGFTNNLQKYINKNLQQNSNPKYTVKWNEQKNVNYQDWNDVAQSCSGEHCGLTPSESEGSILAPCMCTYSPKTCCLISDPEFSIECVCVFACPALDWHSSRVYTAFRPTLSLLVQALGPFDSAYRISGVQDE